MAGAIIVLKQKWFIAAESNLVGSQANLGRRGTRTLAFEGDQGCKRTDAVGVSSQPGLRGKTEGGTSFPMAAKGTRLILGLGAALLIAACAELQGGAERQAGAAAPSPTATGAPEPAVRSAGEGGEPARAAEPARRKPVIARGTGKFVNEAFAKRVAAITTDGDVTLNFVDADLREVVRTILGDVLGLNYFVDPKVAGTVTIQTSRPLARGSLLPALEAILRANGAALVKEGALYRVVPWEGAVRGAAPLRVGTGRGPVPGFGIQIVPLEFVSATEMEKVLESFAPEGSILHVDPARNLLILAGTREERGALLEAVELFDVDWLKGMSFGLFPLTYASPDELVRELDSVFGKETPLAGLLRFVPVERLNAVLVISPRPEYLEQAEEWVGRLDQSADGAVQRVYVYYVQNGRAADLAAVLNEIFGGPAAELPEARLAPDLEPVELRAEAAAAGAPGMAAGAPSRAPPARQPEAAPAPEGAPAAEGIALAPETRIRIIADEANNALVVMATPREYRMVEEAIKKLDITPLQVLIEATILEVTLTDDLKYGLQWFFRTGGSEFSRTGVAGGDFLAQAAEGFSYFFTGNAGDIQLRLNALAEITDLNVVSSPSLMVLDNQTAEIQVGDQVPIATQAAVSVIDPEAPLVNTIELLNTGVILRVTPRVNAGGLVIMEIEQQVSLAVETLTSDIDSPTIRQRSITSTVAIQSGQTVTLGGLITDTRTKESSGIPVLSKIPILGALFGTRTDDTARTELLILITPRVVTSMDEARQVTDELKRRMRKITPLGLRIQ